MDRGNRHSFGMNYTIWKSLVVSTGISFLYKKCEFERTGRKEMMNNPSTDKYSRK